MTGRALLLLALAAGALGGCVVADRSYGLDEGDANYDALKAATTACHAKGGEIRLKGAAYDARQLSSYLCKIG